MASAIVGADDMAIAAPGALEKKWPIARTPRAAQPATQNNGPNCAAPMPRAWTSRQSASAGINTALATKSAVRLANTP
jgi:hypothetical protein